MSFTGSTREGRAVTRDFTETVKRVTLELGGKSPNFVSADCDLDTQVAVAVQGCMFNAGQSCDAPTRLLVKRSRYDEVLVIAKRTTEDIAVGDPAQEGDQIDPLFDRIQAMIQTRIDEGAAVQIGGPGKPEWRERGWFVKPTVITDVSNDMCASHRKRSLVPCWWSSPSRTRAIRSPSPRIGLTVLPSMCKLAILAWRSACPRAFVPVHLTSMAAGSTTSRLLAVTGSPGTAARAN